MSNNIGDGGGIKVSDVRAILSLLATMVPVAVQLGQRLVDEGYEVPEVEQLRDMNTKLRSMEDLK